MHKSTVLPAAFVVVVCVAVIACGGGDPATDVTADSAAADAAPANPLADTSWRLVEIQSMDDAIGTTRPDDPSQYTMTLVADGSVSMRLNCNRATGTWMAEPASDVTSGSFAFGPLAMTRAMCPPPNLDERVAADAEYVRGYLLKDGRLSLSLMADGGIQIWESNPDVAFLADEDADLEAAILRATPEYTADMVDAGTGPARYIYGRVDLNGDRRDEVFVYLLGSIFCGTGGCNMLVLTDEQSGYASVATLPLSRTPVVVSDEVVNGWRTIYKMESGGGASSSWVRYTFDGTTYVEQDRVSGDADPDGLKYLAGEFVFQDGLVLEPGGGTGEEGSGIH